MDFKFSKWLGVAMSLLFSGSILADDVTLKASHQWNTKDVRHQMVQIIADEVASADVGLKVQIYPSKQLYKPKEQWTPFDTRSAGNHRISVSLCGQ